MSDSSTTRSTKIVMDAEHPFIEMGPIGMVRNQLTNTRHVNTKGVDIPAGRYVDRLAIRLGNDFPSTPRRLTIKDMAAIVVSEFLEFAGNQSQRTRRKVSTLIEGWMKELCVDGEETRFYDEVLEVIQRQLKSVFGDHSLEVTELVLDADPPFMLMGPYKEVLSHLEKALEQKHGESQQTHAERAEWSRDIIDGLATRLANHVPGEDRALVPEDMATYVMNEYRLTNGMPQRRREAVYATLTSALKHLCIDDNQLNEHGKPIRTYYQRVMRILQANRLIL